jgi:drug/metabolite transporter (DMT)-like permease
MSAPLSKAFEPSPRLAYALLTATMAMWAICLVVARGVHETVPPIGLAFWRWFGAALILLPFVWGDLVRAWPIVRARWRMFLSLGAVLAAAGVGLVLSVQYTTAINATLVNASQPAITAIGAAMLGRDRLTPWQWLGVAAATVGVVVMAARADLEVLRTFAFNAGDIIVFIATFGYAAYALNVYRLPNEMKLFTSLFLVTVIGAAVIFPVYVWESLAIRPMPLTWEAAGAAFTLAFVWSVLSIFTWNAGNRAVGPARAGMFVNLFPVFSAALAIAFLGERLYAFHLWGAAFVCLGITLVVLAGRKKAQAA